MRDSEPIAELIARMTEAASFAEAVETLASWARDVSGCSTAMVRMADPSGGEAWVPMCSHHGLDAGFVRDETMVTGDECLCGRVALGYVTGDQPPFTPRGSFVYGEMQSLAERFSEGDVGKTRGRCISEGFETVGVFPLVAHEQTVGCLHLADERPHRLDGNVGMLETAGRMAGSVLARYRSWERERVAFASIQSTLMPPVAPTVDGLFIDVCFLSADETAHVGGDFYDVVDLGARGTMLIVGDCSGRGLEAAGMAARARYTMAGIARHASGPAALLAEANALLRPVLPQERFVTAVACLLDPATGEASAALAGHPPPVRLSERLVEEIGPAGDPPLGVTSGHDYAEIRVSFEPLDTLMLYTDGVSEARQDGHLFGVEGIVDVWRRSGGGKPHLLANAVCHAALGFHDPSLPADDRLALTVRLAPR